MTPGGGAESNPGSESLSTSPEIYITSGSDTMRSPSTSPKSQIHQSSYSRPAIAPTESATSYFGVLSPGTPGSSSHSSRSGSSGRPSGVRLGSMSHPVSPRGGNRHVTLGGISNAHAALRDRFRHMERGMTMDEVHQYGILDDDEKSHDFENMDLDEKAIKRLPKKLRGYYEHLAVLKDHYEEVDQLLSGEIPKKIATSFQQSRKKSLDRVNGSYGAMNGGHHGNEGLHSPAESEGATPWLHGSRTGAQGRSGGDSHPRRESSSTIKQGRDNGDAENGERTGLLTGSQREERRERIAKIALNVNTIVNILLVAAKVFAVLYSSSVSLLASLVDSALDTLSTFIILATSFAIGIKTDRHLYPAGKKRFEPLGVLIFSVAMIASFIQVFIEAFQRARGATEEDPVDLSVGALSTMIATIVIKAVLWLWCRTIPSSGVQALAQDAENDVWLNIMSLAFPFAGQKLGWRLLDPLGGMVLSSYIIIEWIKTLLLNFAKLSGRTASRDQITRVLYLVTRFNPVLSIGDIEVYHIGDDLIVEVDIILPSNSSLHFAHDVSETIQCVLESLDGVLRAYVHPDYSSYNPQQHTSRLPNTPGTASTTQTPGGTGGGAQSDAINLPDRQNLGVSPPGSVTPTQNALLKTHGLLPVVPEGAVDGAGVTGMMESGTAMSLPG